VPEDTNDRVDVFVWDRETGATTRASVSSSETQATEGAVSYGIAISRNGRYVAFRSSSTDLAPGDANGLDDIFVRDRVAGTTVRVPAESTGEPATDTDGSKFVGLGGAAISLDGRYVAFNTLRGIPVPAGLLLREESDVYVRDLQTATTTRITQGARGQARLGVSIDADGTHLAFGQGGDIVVRNLRTGGTQRVTPASTGDPDVFRLHSPSLSRSGRFVAFSSDTQREDFIQILVNVYVRDLDTGKTVRVSNNPQADPLKGFNGPPDLSGDGRWVAWGSTASDLVKGDTNGVEDVFVAPARPIR
jgi:Tol biopolymer transport system component